MRFTPPSGTVSVSTDGTNTFSIPINGQFEDLIVVNKTINTIGLKTTFDGQELFFHSNGLDEDDYLLESKFKQITGNLSRFKTTVATAGTHGLTTSDVVKLNVEPNLNVGIGTSTHINVSYNETYKKLLFDSVGFASSDVSLSSFTYNKPTQKSTLDVYEGSQFAVGMGTTGYRTAQEMHDYIWNNYNTFDLDGDGVVSPTDTLIAHRQMINETLGTGFAGDSLIKDIVFPGNAIRRTADAIRTHITNTTGGVGIASTTFDINHSGIVNPEIDGVLLERFTSRVGLAAPTKVDPSSNRGSIKIENHSFKTGDKVLYVGNSGILTPVEDGEYYAIKTDDNNIQLALTTDDCFSDPPNAVSIGFSGSENQTLSIINPQIRITKNNLLNFNLSDTSLTGYDLKVFYDRDFRHEFNSTDKTSSFSITRTGTPGVAATTIIDCDDKIPQNLYYALVNSGTTLDPDFDVVDYSEIVYDDSLYINNTNYLISGVTTNTFDIFLQRIPERKQYLKADCDKLEYFTESRSAFGPINQIEITSGKVDYLDIPVQTSTQSTIGRDANIILNSAVIGDVKEVSIVNEGFNYPSDPTLRPSAYISPQLFIKDANGIKNIDITFGGRNYSVAPGIIIVDEVTGNRLDTGILTAKPFWYFHWIY